MALLEGKTIGKPQAKIRLAFFECNYPELPKPGYKRACDAIEASLLFKVQRQFYIHVFCFQQSIFFGTT